MWEIVKRRVEFHALELSAALPEGLRYPLQALAVRGRYPPLGDGLDGGHVRESCGCIVREGAVPARLVPLFSPIEERAGNINRVDFK